MLISLTMASNPWFYIPLPEAQDVQLGVYDGRHPRARRLPEGWHHGPIICPIMSYDQAQALGKHVIERLASYYSALDNKNALFNFRRSGKGWEFRATADYDDWVLLNLTPAHKEILEIRAAKIANKDF